MSSRPILFLDVDGVLNCRGCFRRHARAQHTNKVVGKGHVEVLKQIVRMTDTRIVLSSLWRLGFDPSEFNAFLVKNGLSGDPVFDRTPVVNSLSEPRGLEIQTWLNRNTWFDGPFCILDDGDDMLHLKPKLVRTRWHRGLRPEHIEQCIALLGGA